MLLRRIEQFLTHHAMPATKFGRLAAHDPRFVLDLRMGRTPRPETEARTLAWMRDYASAQATAAEAVPADRETAHAA
ncbi:MAG: hypothetical protein MUF47_09765 [Porphyrobacter sp.]|jgi:hypothetical protein|nr:hypothetical protein [Porphyrobacter sp.]